jgi:hypothetical protein
MAGEKHISDTDRINKDSHTLSAQSKIATGISACLTRSAMIGIRGLAQRVELTHVRFATISGTKPGVFFELGCIPL